MTRGRPRKFASTTPVLVRVPDELLENLDEWVEEVRAAELGTSTVSRSDLIRDILTRAVKEHRAPQTSPAPVPTPRRSSGSPAKKSLKTRPRRS